jgi:putative Holliday junction resolvase
VRVLAVDPGERHLGVAISDPTGLVARPLSTITHSARAKDAAALAKLAADNEAELILIGYALDADGLPGPQARHAEKLAEAVRALTAIPIELYDESYSSQDALASLRAAGKNRRDQREQIHAAAAATILQSYLDTITREAPPE